MRYKVLSFFAAAFVLKTTVNAQVLHEVVGQANATNGNPIAGFAYDPSRDEMFVTSFGAGGSLRKITNVSTGTQTSTVYVSESQLQLFYRDGNPDRGVSTPLQSGFLLNPQAVGAAPAYSFALLTDASFTRLPASTTTDPSVTKRVYSFNLQQVPAGGDGRDVFSTRATLANLNTAAGLGSNTTSNTGRQFAWSGDGQSIYFADSSSPTTAVGGIWKMGAISGAPVRLLAQDDVNTEPAVVRTAGVDKIYFRGGGSTGNLNGIDFITHDGTTTSSRQVAVSAAALREFLELPAAAPVAIFSMTSDSDGNIYFNHTSGASNSTGAHDSRGLYKLDTQGRLSKVVSYAERAAFTGATPNANMLRQQVRSATHIGPGGSFQINQVLYAETSGINAILAADIFLTGDFNRDNLINETDIALLKPQITTRGVTTTDVAKFKFDINGNSGIDWKDVKLYQPFFDYGDGDINLNGIVDFADFQLLQNSFGQTGKSWLDGDLSGDNQVTFTDFQLLQNSFGYRSSILGLNLAPAAFDAAQWDAFSAAVPEPGVAGMLGACCLSGLLARRRKQA